MPKIVTPLTDIKIKNAKPEAKPYKLADGGGLYLEVTPTGSKLWRMKFKQANGKENRLSFGIYPDVTVMQARAKRDAARKLNADGIDPGQAKKDEARLSSEKDANTFEKVARQWHANKASHSWQPQTTAQNLRSLEKDLFPLIGHLPIDTIKGKIMLEALQEIEKRGALEVTRRVATLASGIFRYAVTKELIEYDPIPALRNELKPRVKGHHAAITVSGLPDLMVALGKNEARMYPPNRIGLRLMTLTFIRTSELTETPWAEIDLDNEQWIIPWHRMKMGKKKVKPRKVDHHPFLPPQGWALLRELHTYTGGGTYLFPNTRDHNRPVSNGMILAALKNMGYGGKMTGHGFRSLAKGILKTLGYPVDRIELQLSHASGEAYGGAYDREEFLTERKAMMQHYADYLGQIEHGNVIIGNFSKTA